MRRFTGEEIDSFDTRALTSATAPALLARRQRREVQYDGREFLECKPLFIKNRQQN